MVLGAWEATKDPNFVLNIHCLWSDVVLRLFTRLWITSVCADLSPHVVCIVEAWVDDSVLDNWTDISNYWLVYETKHVL